MSGSTALPANRQLQADLAIAAGLFITAALLRLPLAEFGETVDESLDPILSALAFRDHLEFVHPTFFHFGYGRGLSWIPLVVGSPDGLYEVALRRGLVQALIAPTVFVSARLLLRHLIGSGAGCTLGPALFALVLASNEDLLHTGISGHETYMAAEWVALVMLAIGLLPRAPRAAPLLLGAAVSMALMNHPLASPAIVLLAAPKSWRGRGLALAAALLVLLPQILRATTLLHGALPPGLAALPPLGDGGRTAEVLAALRPGQHLDVALLLAAPPLGCLVLRRSPLLRLAILGSTALVLALAIVAAAGSQQGWYWRPLAPMGAVLGGCALAVLLSRVPKLAPGAAAVLVTVCVLSVLRAGAAYEPSEDGLRDAGHVTGMGSYLSERPDEAPWAIRAMAVPAGSGRSQLLPLAIDRRVARAATGLFSRGDESLRRPLLLHVEVAPGQTKSLKERLPDSGFEVLASGRQYLVLRFPSGAAALPAIHSLCQTSPGPVAFDDEKRWWAVLGEEAEPWVQCNQAPQHDPG
ncbi:MAG: hypothetical protein VX498_13285 [Myxococcota bacterium]|nr:hypothetical protein [Myxococcota bacterium]